jgi:hypothetical protein
VVQTYFAFVIWSFVKRIQDGTVDKYGRLTIIPLGEFGGYHIREDGMPVQDAIPTAPVVVDMTNVPRAIPLVNRSPISPCPPTAYVPGDGSGPEPTAPVFDLSQEGLVNQDRSPPNYAFEQGGGVNPIYMPGLAPGHSSSDSAPLGNSRTIDPDTSMTSRTSSVAQEVLSAHPPVGAEFGSRNEVQLVAARNVRPGNSSSLARDIWIHDQGFESSLRGARNHRNPPRA